MPIDYGRYVARAWEVFSRNRVLWWLGVVVASLSGVLAAFSIAVPFLFLGAFMDPAFVESDAAVDFEVFWAQWGGVFGAFACLLVILTFLLSWVSAGGEAALAAATDHVERTGERLALGAAWGLGRRRVVPVWLLGLVIGLAVFAVVAVLAVPFGVFLVGLINDPDSAGAATGITLLTLCVGGLSILAIPVALVVGGMREFAVRAIVLENESVFGALGSGWRLLRQNLGPVAVTFLIMFLVASIQSIIINIVVTPVSFLLMIPLFASMAESPTATPTIPGPFVACLGVILGLVIIAVTAPFISFNSVLWTILYRNRRGLPNSDLSARPAIPIVPPPTPYGPVPGAPYGGGYPPPSGGPGAAPPPPPPGLGFTPPPAGPGGVQYGGPPPDAARGPEPGSSA